MTKADGPLQRDGRIAGSTEADNSDLDGLERYRSLKRSTLVLASGSLAVAIGVTPAASLGISSNGVADLAWGLLFGGALYYAWGALQELRFVNLRNSPIGQKTNSIEGVFDQIEATISSIASSQSALEKDLREALDAVQLGEPKEALVTAISAELRQGSADALRFHKSELELFGPNLSDADRAGILERTAGKLEEAIWAIKARRDQAASKWELAGESATEAFANIPEVGRQIADLRTAALFISARVSGARRFHFWTWDVLAPGLLLGLALITGAPSAAVLIHRSLSADEIWSQYREEVSCAFTTGGKRCLADPEPPQK